MGLKKLGAQHYALMRYLATGERNADIALKLQRHPAWISHCKADPLFRAAYEGFLQDIYRRSAEAIATGEYGDPVTAVLKQAAPQAAQLMTEMMLKGSTDTVKLRAMQDILDRTGYKPKQQIEATNKVVIDDKRSDDLTTALREDRSWTQHLSGN